MKLTDLAPMSAPDLIAALRDAQHPLTNAAADEIERLRDALKPFVEEFDWCVEDDGLSNDSDRIWLGEGEIASVLTYGVVRRAYALLNAKNTPDA